MRRDARVRDYDAKPPAYFRNARRDLVAMLPEDAHHVLDVGCGAGELGRLLKIERGCCVCGIEVSEAALQAMEHLDEVVHGDVEGVDLSAWAGRFDVIVYADVLEHLYDPWDTLERHRRLLATGGIVVASLPNVQHHSILTGLVRGRWEYRTAGLLDRTHLRFFTRSSVIAMFVRAGYQIDSVCANTMGRAAQCVHWLSQGAADGFLAYKWIVRARLPSCMGVQRSGA